MQHKTEFYPRIVVSELERAMKAVDGLYYNCHYDYHMKSQKEKASGIANYWTIARDELVEYLQTKVDSNLNFK